MYNILRSLCGSAVKIYFQGRLYEGKLKKEIVNPSLFVVGDTIGKGRYRQEVIYAEFLEQNVERIVFDRALNTAPVCTIYLDQYVRRPR